MEIKLSSQIIIWHKDNWASLCHVDERFRDAVWGGILSILSFRQNGILLPLLSPLPLLSFNICILQIDNVNSSIIGNKRWPEIHRKLGWGKWRKYSRILDTRWVYMGCAPPPDPPLCCHRHSCLNRGDCMRWVGGLSRHQEWGISLLPPPTITLYFFLLSQRASLYRSS